MVIVLYGGILSSYADGRGQAAYHPQMLSGLLIYGYCTGIFSSRRMSKPRLPGRGPLVSDAFQRLGGLPACSPEFEEVMGGTDEAPFSPGFRSATE